MALKYGFYNSLDHENPDRVYDADDMNNVLSGIISDGVLSGVEDELSVKIKSGFVITVGRGKAWFNGTWSHNTQNYDIEIMPSSPLNPRIDSVILEINKKNREIR